MRLKLERNGIMVADSKPFETLIEDLAEERRQRRARSPSLPRRRSLSPRRRWGLWDCLEGIRCADSCTM